MMFLLDQDMEDSSHALMATQKTVMLSRINVDIYCGRDTGEDY